MLSDPDLSKWLGQVEMSIFVVELTDEKSVGVTSLRPVVRQPAVGDGTPVSHELLLPGQPVLEVEVSDAQDDFEFAVALLSRVDVHDVELRRDAIVVEVDVVARPHETHAVVVHRRHA